MKNKSPKFSHPLFSEVWLADRYLRYGSVEEAINSFDGHFPVSVADYHRKIKKFGIVKKVGRRKVSIAKTLYFFAQKANSPTIPLEKLYKKMPLSFKETASIATLHRIYSGAMGKAVRLHATGVIVTREGDPNRILIADELETKLGTGKTSGNATIPFSFANKNEGFATSVLRALQKEVSTKLTLQKKLTINGPLAKKLAPSNIQPFLHFHILDVEINVFQVQLPTSLNIERGLSSYEVGSHRFVHVDEITKDKDIAYRTGVPEIASAYKSSLYASAEAAVAPQIVTSSLNNALLAPATTK